MKLLFLKLTKFQRKDHSVWAWERDKLSSVIMSFFSYISLKNIENQSHNYFKTWNLPKNEMFILKELHMQNKQDRKWVYPLQKGIKLMSFFLKRIIQMSMDSKKKVRLLESWKKGWQNNIYFFQLNVGPSKEDIFLTTFYGLFHSISTICQSAEYILELYIRIQIWINQVLIFIEKFSPLSGFEPQTSRVPCLCATNWAIQA